LKRLGLGLQDSVPAPAPVIRRTAAKSRLAHAVVAEPTALADEPLSPRSGHRPACAASLPVSAPTGLTTIIVTHEREEAEADRVAVLVDGRIQQHATPQEVYERPANLAVARFMGVNLLSVRVVSNGRAELRNNPFCRLEMPRSAGTGSVELSIVPEQTRVAENRSGMTNVFPVELLRSQYRGGEYRLQVRIGNPETGQILEARSHENPCRERLFIHLPVDSLHIVRSSPSGATQTVASLPVINRSPAEFQEEIA
jgi:ABC-type Fe3+/spermidine/putrescine transport system ATPase subunit